VRFFRLFCLVCVLSACGDDAAPTGAQLGFDLSGDVAGADRFFDHPFPSDLRLDADHRPDLSGFPNPKNTPLAADLIAVAGDRTWWPVNTNTYFKSDALLTPRTIDDGVMSKTTDPVLLINLATNTLVPIIVQTTPPDEYIGHKGGIAVAPRPGVILEPNSTYATVVLRSYNDAGGNPLAQPAALRDLASGKTPDGAWAADAATLLQPMWQSLDALGVDRSEVAGATVFSTGDTVADTHDLAKALADMYPVTIDNLQLDPDDGDHPDFCELIGTIDFPQFQVGTPPFNTDGQFELDTSGLPIMQRTEQSPIVILIPKREMPADGFPLIQYFHGSGGRHNEVVDRGYIATEGGTPQPGTGPGMLFAQQGIASAGSALPISPDRVPSASDIAYLNFNNMKAFPYLFRQGVIEQRMYLDALLELRISPATLGSCAGATLPAGASEFRFDGTKVFGQGQSMGGMYTNMITATDERFKLAVPTGAGGMWSRMILLTTLLSNIPDLLSVVLDVPLDELDFMHPALHLVEHGWEAAEPFVYMARVAHNPLRGHPVRSIYEPVGKDDVYFATPIYDGAALAYGNEQAGNAVWPTMQDALAVDGLDGIVDYNVSQNVTSVDGTPYTGVVVQYEGDGIRDPHYIFVQREEVKYQYSCFYASWLRDGVATVPAPATLGTPCP